MSFIRLFAVLVGLVTRSCSEQVSLPGEEHGPCKEGATCEPGLVCLPRYSVCAKPPNKKHDGETGRAATSSFKQCDLLRSWV